MFKRGITKIINCKWIMFSILLRNEFYSVTFIENSLRLAILKRGKTRLSPGIYIL